MVCLAAVSGSGQSKASADTQPLYPISSKCLGNRFHWSVSVTDGLTVAVCEVGSAPRCFAPSSECLSDVFLFDVHVEEIGQEEHLPFEGRPKGTGVSKTVEQVSFITVGGFRR